MKQHRPWARKTLVAATVLVIAASAAAAATAGNGAHHSKRTTKQVATLKHHLAAAKRENARLKSRYTPAGIAHQLEATKIALDKYQSVGAAKAAGYVAASPCEATPTDPDQSSYGGGMGFHYVNGAIAGSGKLDPKKPAILVYAPASDGGLQLVAAEYFKADADQNVKTDGDRPTLFGRAFDGPMLGHAPGMPIHYDLHVWLWKHNPSGLFASWNPDVTCPS